MPLLGFTPSQSLNAYTFWQHFMIWSWGITCCNKPSIAQRQQAIKGCGRRFERATTMRCIFMKSRVLTVVSVKKAE